MPTINDLRDALPRLDEKSRAFAQSLISGYERYGSLTAKQQPFVAKLVERANQPAKPATASVAVGDMTGILALFERAKSHLKFPAIEIGVPGNEAIRLNLAGEKLDRGRVRRQVRQELRARVGLAPRRIRGGRVMIIVTARKNVTVRAYGPFTDFDTALRWAELNIADQSDEFSILEVELADGAATDGIEDYNNLARREAVR